LTSSGFKTEQDIGNLKIKLLLIFLGLRRLGRFSPNFYKGSNSAKFGRNLDFDVI